MRDVAVRGLPSRSPERGFTLLELIIICGVLGILAALSIPYLVDARYAGNESDAILFLRTVHTAEEQHHNKDQRYGTLAELVSKKLLLRPDTGVYTINIAIAPDGITWTATATPVVRADRLRHFYIDLSGVVRYKLGAPADGSSDPV